MSFLNKTNLLRIASTANNSGMIRFDKGGGAVTVSGTGVFDLYVAHGPNYNRWLVSIFKSFSSGPIP